MSGVRRPKPKIKPPKKHGPTVSIDDTWTKLKTNIVEIQNHRAMNLSYEENHRYAYNMVLMKSGETLYKGTCQLISDNLEKLAKQYIIPAFPSGTGDLIQRSQEGEMLLKAIRKVWDDHTSSLSKLSDVLKYMDRVYTKSAGVPEIWSQGLLLYIEHIIRPPIQGHLVSAVLTQIQTERDGFTINRSAVKGCVDVLLQLHESSDAPNMYKKILEPAVIREGRAFYQSEGERLLETCDAPEYLRKVEERMFSEQDRTHHYLSAQTSIPLRTIIENNLLTPHLSTIIGMPNSGLDAMIDGDKLDDLSRLYRLFTMVPNGPITLRRSVRDSIVRRGKAIASGGGMDAMDGDDEPEDPKGKGKAKATGGNVQTLQIALRWVQDVLDLKDKFHRIWEKAFRSDRELDTGMNEAFETFVNLHEKSPEFISLFIDENLKKGLKGKTDEEVDSVLDKTITVFRYLTDKDVFERYYKGHLAKRLLLGRSVSDDAERGMLAKLKVECGFQFTQKLEGMFHDMRISEDTMKAYRNHLEDTTAPDVDISVIVMTSTFWPMSHSAASCILPEELLKASKSFEQFYF